MASKRRIVGHDHAVTDLAIMRNVHTSHEQAAISDTRYSTAVRRPGMHRYMFADLVVAADDEIGLFTAVFQILRSMSKACEWKNAAVSAERRSTGDNDMGFQPTSLIDLHVGSDMTEGADPDIICKLGTRIYDG
jgi:hypothetical protein